MRRKPRPKRKRDPRHLLSRLTRRHFALSEHLWSGSAGLQAIALRLTRKPLDTAELAREFRLNRNDLALRLRAGSRKGLLIETPRCISKGCGKIGRLPSIWSYSDAGATKLADEQASPPQSPLDSLPRSQRDILERWDFEREGLSAHQAWRIARLSAVFGLDRRTIKQCDLEKLLGNSRGYAKQVVSFSERKGHLIVHRPPKKGAVGRLPNSYEVPWESFKPRSDGSRRSLAPQRSLKQLADLPPKRDRRTGQQRKWCKAIEWSATGLRTAQHWADALSLLAAIGTSRVVTYAGLAEENGWGEQAIEKCVRRLKSAGLIELATPPGGRSGQTREWRPNWEKFAALVGRKAQSAPPAKQAVQSETVEWSDPAPPAKWLKVFRGQTWKTVRRRITRGEILGEPQTRKRWWFRLSDLPPNYKRLMDS